MYPHHTHEIWSQKKKKRKKKKGNHEPTSQIKTSLIVNEDISKQREALKEICKAYTNGCMISNWNATVTFFIDAGYKLFSTNLVRPNLFSLHTPQPWDHSE